MSIPNKVQPSSCQRFSPLLRGFHSSLNAFTTSFTLANLIHNRNISTKKTAFLSALDAQTVLEGQKKLSEAIIKEGYKNHRAFLKGIDVYEAAPRKPTPRMPTPLWQKGSARIFDFGEKYPMQAFQQSVLFIPSLINKAYIFDLSEHKGFFSFLAQQGIRPYLFDWGTCTIEEASFTLKNYLKRRLLPGFQFLAEKNQAALSVAGYCMGGIFATALKSLAPDLVRSLTLFATPWDFHQGPYNPFMMQNLAYWSKAFFSPYEKVPGDFLQLFFHLMDPFAIQKKFQQFAKLDLKEKSSPLILSPHFDHYFAIEDWLNDTESLSLSVFLECCKEWYGDNSPYLQKKAVGISLEPELKGFPTYVVTPTKDRLVPELCSRGILSLFPDATIAAPETGHVGLFASSRAQETVWAPYAAWIKQL